MSGDHERSEEGAVASRTSGARGREAEEGAELAQANEDACFASAACIVDGGRAGAAWLLLSQRVYTRDLLTGSKMFSGEVQSSFGTYATSSARSWLEPCAIAAVAAR